MPDSYSSFRMTAGSTRAPHAAEDDVVEQLDAEELTGGGQAPRQRDVLKLEPAEDERRR